MRYSYEYKKILFHFKDFLSCSLTFGASVFRTFVPPFKG